MICRVIIIDNMVKYLVIDNPAKEPSKEKEIKIMKKPETSTKGAKSTKTQEAIEITSYQVSRVRTVGNSVCFDLELNGVKIYGLFVVEGKTGDFISWPSRKGSDGKYYNYCYAALSDKDLKDILAEVETQLNQ